MKYRLFMFLSDSWKGLAKTFVALKIPYAILQAVKCYCVTVEVQVTKVLSNHTNYTPANLGNLLNEFIKLV